MSTIEITVYLSAMGISIICAFVAVFLWGYQRGRISVVPEPVIDSTPKDYKLVDEVMDTLAIEIVGHLDPITGPIILPGEVVIVTPELQLIDHLRSQLAIEKLKVTAMDRLRKRYLLLLKAERAMMSQVIHGGGVTLTSYWKRQVRAQFDEGSPFWTSSSWARIANIGRASDSSVH